MRTSRLLSFLFALLSFSCDKPLPKLEGIDTDAWARDLHACGDARLSMYEAIDREKEKLLGLDQIEIVQLLGKPDENELSSRNQKFFYYYLDPAPLCKDSTATQSRRLVIRFNAVGLAKEALIE